MDARHLGYLLPLALPLTVPVGVALGGVGTFLPLGVAFVLVPLVDHVVGTDADATLPTPPSARSRRAFDALLYAWIPVHVALLAWGAAAFVGTSSTLEAAGVALSVGALTGGIGITVAHELGHRLGRVDRACSFLLLASTAYAHFQIEHNQGHHARVATPEDPATARAGESLYRFVPRSVVRGFACAWSLEAARLARAGCRTVSLRNRMLWGLAAALAVAGLLAGAYGPGALAFWAVQATVAVGLLEAVNYVEHYGLLRTRGPDGRYERVRAAHSWNSSHRVSNWLLFNLQRHSHHHAHVTTHYEELRHRDDAPQLPTGYPAAVLIALVPPLWRRVMEPRLARWRAAGMGAVRA